jgi:hypothetical protein
MSRPRRRPRSTVRASTPVKAVTHETLVWRVDWTARSVRVARAVDCNAARRNALVLVFKVHTFALGVAILAWLVTAGSCAESLELCGPQIGLGLDERAAIVAHWLVPSVGILGQECPY